MFSSTEAQATGRCVMAKRRNSMVKIFRLVGFRARRITGALASRYSFCTHDPL
jgi:hypothetical protein